MQFRFLVHTEAEAINQRTNDCTCLTTLEKHSNLIKAADGQSGLIAGWQCRAAPTVLAIATECDSLE